MAKTALITGGGGAIALALAEKLEARGFDLILTDRDMGRMAETAGRLTRVVDQVTADLSHAADIAELCRYIKERRPVIDLLVNNAGLILPGPVTEISEEDMTLHIQVNLIAPMCLTRAAARAMTPRGSGQILSIVSAAALIALPGSAAYSASKFGLRGFLASVRLELAPLGIQVTAVLPGAVDTPMLRYEATHGGSVLNFLNKSVLTVDQVAEAALRALDGDKAEIYVPYSDGVIGRLAGSLPWMLPKLLPMLEAEGRKGHARFLTERGLEA
ncbi:MAG TPA: SDR family NAD(P)-dependent oxidoreductase [Caulobacteraceae bacterium]